MNDIFNASECLLFISACFLAQVLADALCPEMRRYVILVLEWVRESCRASMQCSAKRKVEHDVQC